jgi:uncharacterized low-complexity protein
MIIRTPAIALAVLLGLAATADSDVFSSPAAIEGIDQMVADNENRDDRQEGRQEGRDDRRDCRQEEGRIGKDKRDCKQEKRDEGDDKEGKHT